MAATTSIAWTDRTWNPVRGCSVISPGCVNCYAMKFAHRFSAPGKPYAGLTKQTAAGPQWTGQIRLVEDALLAPLKWRKPARIFVNSMSDLFHESVPDEFIASVFAVMALAKRHTFQVLTKRADRMRSLVARISEDVPGLIRLARSYDAHEPPMDEEPTWPLPNVWLGVSVENQQQADARIPLLLQTPGAVRWVSAEPLLGPVDLSALPSVSGIGRHFDALSSAGAKFSDLPNRLDWVVVGGESGPGARPCRVAWVRDIVRQCQTAAVPAFVKQLGANVEGDERPAERRNPLTGARILTVMQSIEITDRKGGDPAEWPEDLRVREFPRA